MAENSESAIIPSWQSLNSLTLLLSPAHSIPSDSHIGSIPAKFLETVERSLKSLHSLHLVDKQEDRDFFETDIRLSPLFLLIKFVDGFSQWQSQAVSKVLTDPSNIMINLNSDQQLTDINTKLIDCTEALRKSNFLSSAMKEELSKTISSGLEKLNSKKISLLTVCGLLLMPLFDAYCSTVENVVKPYFEIAAQSVVSMIAPLIGTAL